MVGPPRAHNATPIEHPPRNTDSSSRETKSPQERYHKRPSRTITSTQSLSFKHHFSLECSLSTSLYPSYLLPPWFRTFRYLLFAITAVQNVLYIILDIHISLCKRAPQFEEARITRSIKVPPYYTVHGKHRRVMRQEKERGKTQRRVSEFGV